MEKYEISKELFDWILNQVSKLNLEEYEAIVEGNEVKARIWNERINRLLKMLETSEVKK